MKILLVALLLIGVIGTSSAQPPPDFTLYDQDSVAWNLYDELGKGNTVLLDFFYANCVPCQTFTPEIEQLYQDYGSGTGNLIVLGISDRDNNAALAAFDTTYNVTYPTGGTQGNGNTITNLYMTWFPFFAWPRYAVICTDTTIFWDVEPALGMSKLRNTIDSCDIVTEVNDIISTNQLVRLYPNPGQGNLNVKLLNTPSEEVSVSIYSLQGTLMMETTMRGLMLNWDVSGLQFGSYIVIVAQGNAILVREKLLLIN